MVMTLMIAESKPKEKGSMVGLVRLNLGGFVRCPIGHGRLANRKRPSRFKATACKEVAVF